jgi:hypothetical protein
MSLVHEIVHLVADLVRSRQLDPAQAFREVAPVLAEFAMSPAIATPERLGEAHRRVHTALEPLLPKEDL